MYVILCKYVIMASSQIRQFATLIDQLPCEADDFNIMENFEDYSKCFESSLRNNNLKNSNSFLPFNSNLNEYINNISNSHLNLNYRNLNKNKISNSTFNENGNKNLFSKNYDTQKKNNDYDNLKNININYINTGEPSSCTNNETHKNINKTDIFDENNGNKNQRDTSNGNNFNSLLSHINDFPNYEKNNYIEKSKNEIEVTKCKYITNKGNSLYKSNLSEIIVHNNEYLVDGKFSNNNKNSDKILLHNLNKHSDEKSCSKNLENIVYRYDVNKLDPKGLKYNNNKNDMDNLKANTDINDNNDENHINELLNKYKHIANSGEINKENISNILFINEKIGINEENNKCTNNDNNLDNNDCNNRKSLNKNIILKDSISENSTIVDHKVFYDISKKNNFNKNILLAKKAKVIKIDPNKSLVIFPVNIHEYGEKYIAVNQKDLLEYISSSIEFDDNEDIFSLKTKIYQKEKELQNIKAAYSMQTTNIHYLINRVIFKECEYEQLKHKSLTLEHEINKLIQEINSLINQNKEGLSMQKTFIDYKCKCVLKLQELQPLLGSYYFDIFHYITSCRTLGQLSIWIPAFEIKSDSLEYIANHLIKILLSGLGTPFNSSPHYFLSNKNFLKKSVSTESEDTFLNNLAKRKIIDNYLVNNLNSFNTTKENNSHLSNCQSLSINSESSSIMGTEELFFNSSKFPSMHSVILKNNKNNKKNEKIFNEFNRSNTTPEHLCMQSESYNCNDVDNNISNLDSFISNNQNEQEYNNFVLCKENLKKRKLSMTNIEEKKNEKIVRNDKKTEKRGLEKDKDKIEKDDSLNEIGRKLKEIKEQTKEDYEKLNLKEKSKSSEISTLDQIKKNLDKEKNENIEKEKNRHIEKEKNEHIEKKKNKHIEKEKFEENKLDKIYKNQEKERDKKVNKEKEKQKSKENIIINEIETSVEMKNNKEINVDKDINEKRIVEKESNKELNREKELNKKKSIEQETAKKRSVEPAYIERKSVEQQLDKKKSIEQELIKKKKIEKQELTKKKSIEAKDKEKIFETKHIEEKQNENLKDNKCTVKNNKKNNDFNRQRSFKKETDQILDDKNDSKKKKSKNEKLISKIKLKK